MASLCIGGQENKNIQPCSIISKQSVMGLQQERGMQQHHQ